MRMMTGKARRIAAAHRSAMDAISGDIYATVRNALLTWCCGLSRRRACGRRGPGRCAEPSTPTLCAETDNSTEVTSAEARHFTIEAVHRIYIGTIVVDRAPSTCTTAREIAAARSSPKAKRVTIFETPEFRSSSASRSRISGPGTRAVRVGDRVDRRAAPAIVVRSQDRAEEVLVLYPQDGYSRAPLPPATWKWSAYGTRSCRAIEHQQRPFVYIKESCSIRSPRHSGSPSRAAAAHIRVETLNIEHQVLDSRSIASTTAIRALRSMFVSETK